MESELYEEPEIVESKVESINRTESKDTESKDTESKHTGAPENKDTTNSTGERSLSSRIYLVSENNTPVFWCSTMERARKKIYSKLRSLMSDPDKKYYIEENDRTYTLVSTTNYYIIQYEQTETVFTVETIWRK